MPRVGQDSFGGGIFRGRRAPGDSVYDAVNALISDERELYRRGGAAYLTDVDAGGALLGVLSTEMTVGRRTLMWDVAGLLYALDASGDPYSLQSLQLSVPGAEQALMEQGPPFSRPVAVGPFLVFKRRLTTVGSTRMVPEVLVWAGARKGYYNTSTVTVTKNSKSVTGAASVWAANVEVGQILQTSNSPQALGVVAAVTSNTALTLRDAWVGDTAAGANYEIADVGDVQYGAEIDMPLNDAAYPWAIGAVGSPPRLLIGYGNRMYFAPVPGRLTMLTDDEAAASLKASSYHELPQGARILSIGDLRGYAFVFTDDGLWTVGNMELDALDDFGNVQQKVERVSDDLLVWGDDSGLVTWQGQLLAPCRDDVYALSLDAPPAPITRSVRPLYRDYVEAGYRPGIAEVHRGHYLLPIMSADGSTLQDVLVVRLDLADARGNVAPGWTRWDDQAAGAAYSRAEDGKLYGVAGLRVTDLTGCWDPSSAGKADADGTNHQLQVVTQDFASGQIPHTFTGARVALELVDAATDDPTFEVEYSSGPVATEVWTSAGSRGESAGEVPEMFRFAKKVRALRLRVTTTGAAARAVLRSVELLFRDRGRS